MAADDLVNIVDILQSDIVHADGHIARNDNTKITSTYLRRFKDIVEEVKSGTECGIAVKAYNDVQPGDQIECFERIEVKRSL